MSLRTQLNGQYELEDLNRLKFPIAWSGTVDADEAHAEEAELREWVNDAIEQLQQAYDHLGSDNDLAVKVEAGEIQEIVEIGVEAD